MSIFKLLLVSLMAWASVHITAVFGLFIAIIYPFWWLLSPERIEPCLYCYFRSDKHYFRCPICRRQFENGQVINKPSPFKSIINNVVLILAFTVISVITVYFEGKLLFKIGFPPTRKTVSFVIPDRGEYRLGEIFPMKIEIVGIKTPINAVQADISFSPERVEVVDISTRDSFASIFIQKEINNEVGYARLTGGLPNPGFFPDRGFFGTILFKSKQSGLIKIDFLPTSMVLANDSKGTNVLSEFQSVSYLILPEEISPEEDELQKKIVLNRQQEVLGEEIDTTQMKFYEEDKVLGTVTENNIKQSKGFNPLKICLLILETIDKFIFTFWRNIFDLFRFKK